MFMRSFFRNDEGSVHILGAMSLMALIGSLGFSIDLALAYSAKVRNQRVSDMAALSAAQAYNSSGSTSLMTATAEATTRAADLADAVVTTTLGPSPDGKGDAVTVVVTSLEPVYFGRIFGMGPTFSVVGRSVARFVDSTPACIIALSTSATNGIDGTGGTTLTANNCAVSANSRIRAVGGAHMTALSFSTPVGVLTNGGASITTTPTPNKILSNSVSDPLSGNLALDAAFDLLGTYATPTVPSVPTGSNFSPPWGGSYSHSGYAGTWNNSTSTWTFPAGTYAIRNLSVPGGMNVVFSGPATTVTVSGSVSLGGGSDLTIGDGTVSIVSSLSLSGGNTVVIGNGRHYLGPVSVGGGGTLTIGAGDLDVNGILDINGGGSTVTLGAGNYVFGRATSGGNNGRSIFLSGGSTLVMGNGTFSANGHIKTTGGSSITFGATANHLINGDLDLHGSAVFGAGRYTVNGTFTNNTGGTMQGQNVTFILAGQMRLTGGTSLNLAAPSNSLGGGLADILIATRTTTQSYIGGGSQNVYTGALYLPNADIQFAGGAGVSGNGGCFTLIASTITFNGGASTATSCPNVSGSGGKTVRLIQ